jgi:hypothetical protein
MSKACWIFFGALALLILVGCKGDLSAGRPQVELSGWQLLYPAQAGVEPGEIWYTDSTGARHTVYKKPQKLPVSPPSPVFYATQGKTIDYGAVLSGGLTISKSSSLTAKLQAGTVKSFKLDYGRTRTVRIVLGDLDTLANDPKTDAGYLRALEAVRQGESGYYLIDSILLASNLEYTATVADTNIFQAVIPAVTKFLGGKADAHYVGTNTVKWVLPKEEEAVIGINVMGRNLDRVLPAFRFVQMADSVGTIRPYQTGVIHVHAFIDQNSVLSIQGRKARWSNFDAQDVPTGITINNYPWDPKFPCGRCNCESKVDFDGIQPSVPTGPLEISVIKTSGRDTVYLESYDEKTGLIQVRFRDRPNGNAPYDADILWETKR